jgi:acetyl-CoA C-acetyltransferase
MSGSHTPRFARATARPVAIIGGQRLPFCKMGTQYSDESLLDLLLPALEATVKKFGLERQVLGEVALGTTFYHPDFWNLAREVVLKSSLAPETPAMGVQRACATSLEAAVTIANKIAMGQIEVGIAGGVESLSNTTLYLRPGLSRRLIRSSRAKTFGARLKVWQGLQLKDLKPKSPPGVEPTTGLSMGEHCEQMAKTWEIGREEQDVLSLASHQNGERAFARGFYDDLVIPHLGVKRDNNLRADTSLEKLAKLKPSFDTSVAGTLTAGNSSPLTDGAATVLLASEEWAKAHGLPVLAYITDFESAAIDLQTEGLLMAPAYAVPKMLGRSGKSLQDFDFYEIHEAFAAQVLCTLKAWESPEFCKTKLGLLQALGSIDRSKLNVAGGSVALGHPFGATGARILASMAHLLKEKGSGRGLISICTGGGMGTVATIER